MNKFIFILLIFSSVVLNITVGKSQRNIDTTYKNNIVPSPSFTYSPETDIVIGAFALYQFKTKKTDYETRPSYLIGYVASSLNNQVTASIEHNLFLPPEENWFLKGMIQYKRWPEQFYGIGPNSKEENLMISDYQIVTIEQKVYKNLGNKVFLGIQLKYMNSYNVKFYDSEGEEIKAPDIIGKEGALYVGAGFSVLNDERNSILTPTGNYYLEFSNYFFLKSFGSTTNFFSFLIDARKYFDFKTSGKHVLAIQVKALLTSGDVPFIELAKLGGKSIMRGYLEGRYRDKQYLQAQAEYRVKLVGRFGVTTFAGVGNVMPGFSDFDPAYIKAAAGFGLRFNINRKDQANVRIDFGYGFEKNAEGVYITFGEAF